MKRLSQAPIMATAVFITGAILATGFFAWYLTWEMDRMQEQQPVKKIEKPVNKKLQKLREPKEAGKGTKVRLC